MEISKALHVSKWGIVAESTSNYLAELVSVVRTDGLTVYHRFKMGFKSHPLNRVCLYRMRGSNATITKSHRVREEAYRTGIAIVCDLKVR